MNTQSPLYLYAEKNSHERLKTIQLQWSGGGVKEIMSVFTSTSDGFIQGIQNLIQWLYIPLIYDNAAMSKWMSAREDTGANVFSEAFLNYLQRFQFSGEIWAVKEETPIFTGMPVLQIKGSTLQVAILQLWIHCLIQPMVEMQQATNFLQVRRFYNSASQIMENVIYSLENPPIVNFEAASWEDLLQPIFILNP